MPTKRQPSACKPSATARKEGRMFTYADIVAFFNSNFGTQHNPTYAVRSVHLLPEFRPTGWEVHYTATYHNPYEHTYNGTLLVLQQTDYEGKHSLNWAKTVELPAGFPTPQEEDAGIEQCKQARIAVWQQKWEAAQRLSAEALPAIKEAAAEMKEVEKPL